MRREAGSEGDSARRACEALENACQEREPDEGLLQVGTPWPLILVSRVLAIGSIVGSRLSRQAADELWEDDEAAWS